ncbi:MAG: amidohydrolase family protein [Flavobacteriaceae bacterium]|nr:amidohydrolase family protein [Flavobacteriaceae bacterium]
MKLDSHQHFWKYSPQQHNWIDDSMVSLKRDFLPNDLEPHLIENKIEACVVVQADQSEKETEFLLELATQYEFIKGVVGWVDLRAKNVEERLQFYSQNQYFKGVRHIVQSEKQDFLLDPAFQNGIGKLGNLNLTYDLLIYSHQIEAAIKLVSQFPNQKFVLDHLAKPNIKKGKIDPWKNQIQRMAQFSNVSCKISGMVTEADHAQWKPSDFIPYLDIVFDAFGENRILFGSDWPVCLLAASYQEVYQLITDYTVNFSLEQRDKLFGANAERFYNIIN